MAFYILLFLLSCTVISGKIQSSLPSVVASNFNPFESNTNQWKSSSAGASQKVDQPSDIKFEYESPKGSNEYEGSVQRTLSDFQTRGLAFEVFFLLFFIDVYNAINHKR